MWGRLEHEIRLLPQVVAVSVTPRDVVVLLAPGSDQTAAERLVAPIVAAHGAPQTVRVLGGTEPVIRTLSPAARRWSLAGAAAAASFVMALGSFSGHVEPAPVLPDARPTPATGVSGDRAAPAVRVTPVSPPAPTEARVLAVGVVRTASATTAGVRAVRIARPSATTGDVAPRVTTGSADGAAPTSTVTRTSCRRPPDRGAPRTRQGRHRGNGPRPWSYSVLVPPHPDCARGR